MDTRAPMASGTPDFVRTSSTRFGTTSPTPTRAPAPTTRPVYLMPFQIDFPNLPIAFLLFQRREVYHGCRGAHDRKPSRIYDIKLEPRANPGQKNPDPGPGSGGTEGFINVQIFVVAHGLGPNPELEVVAVRGVRLEVRSLLSRRRGVSARDPGLGSAPC